MSKRILSLVLAFVMVLGTFGTVFADVATTPVVNEKVQWLQDQGLVKGDQNGNLNLESKIDRASVAKLVVEALGKSGDGMKSYQGPFSDVSVSHWSNGNINMVYGLGLMKGNEGKFMPTNEISYAEVLTILVRMMDAEPANAVWPATHIAKAQELGIINGVEITDYMTPAVREDIFEMFYNVLTDKEVGNYTILKAIVLENYRVESLDKDEVVVEVIKEIQTADYATTSRKEKGDQISLVIDAKVGDVEELLGKVVDFTLDKNGKVVKVAYDNSYDYLEGTVTDRTAKSLELDYSKYTVSLDERYKDNDERIFRTYFNNEAMSYADFNSNEDIDGDYVRITVKNGKVLFIDAFDFSDIAPVVNSTEKYITVLDDKASASELDIKASNVKHVIDVTDGVFTVGEFSDIEKNDVVHAFGKTLLVKKDAAVEGTFDRVRTNRLDASGNWVTYLELKNDESATVNFKSSTQAIYTKNYKDFFVLNNTNINSTMADFYGKEVVMLVDMTGDVQFVGATVESSTFEGLLRDILGRELRVATENGEDKYYEVTFKTIYGTDGTTRESRLSEFAINDLVRVSLASDGTISRLTKIATPNTGINIDKINKDFVRYNSVDYRLVRDTNFYINNGTSMKGVTIEQLIADYITVDGTTAANAHPTYPMIAKIILNADNTVDTIIFTTITERASYDYAQVRVVDVWAAGYNYKIKVEKADKTVVTYDVVYLSQAYNDISTIKTNDIIRVGLTKTEEPKIGTFTKSINYGTVVLRISQILEGGKTLKLVDVNNVEHTLHVSNYVTMFDRISTGDKVQFRLTNEFIDIIDVVPTNATLTNYNGSTSAVTNVVTYISGTAIEVDNKTIYTVDSRTRLKDAEGNTLGLGLEITDKLVKGDVIEVKDNVITLKVSYAKVAADEVVALIEALGEITELSQNAEVEAARSAYNALTDEQKALVPAEVVALLTAAEAKIAELETPPTETNTLEGKVLATIGGNTVEVEVEDGTLIEEIIMDGVKLIEENFDYGIDGNVVTIALGDAETAEITITIAGTMYTVVLV